jgi:hypothetical protein
MNNYFIIILDIFKHHFQEKDLKVLLKLNLGLGTLNPFKKFNILKKE